MGAPDLARLIPNCRISLDGQPLSVENDGALVRLEVDLDSELFAQCSMVFVDTGLRLINGTTFSSGLAVKVELGFAASLQTVFEGEVVALEPRFLRDRPPALRVVCQEALHRLALSQMTRAFNDADDKQIATTIAQEHGLSCDAPEGTKEHVLQANVSDAAFLRKRAQLHGNHLRMVGTKLVISAPGEEDSDVTLKPGSGVRKISLKIKGNQQIGAVTVHGWDPVQKREISGRAEPQGDAGEGARQHGGDAVLSVEGSTVRDVATAESMARGRMRRLAEKFVTAEIELIGDARLVPHKVFTLDGVDDKLDGKYRVERAVHSFDKHGYRLNLKATRVKKKQVTRQAQPSPEPQLENPRWGKGRYEHSERAEMLVDARNLEGRYVRFSVDHKGCSGRWEAWAVSTSVVEGGKATGYVDLQHPMAKHYDGSDDAPCPNAVHGDRDFRFEVALAAGGGKRTGPAPAEPTDDKLENPRWGNEQHGHGDRAEMIVDAHGWNDRTVFFSLEHDRGNGNWEPWGQPVEAVVRHCRAVGLASLEHPLARHFAERGAVAPDDRDAKAGPRQLRFNASFTRPTGAAR